MGSVVSSKDGASPGRTSLQNKKVMFYPDYADVVKESKMLYNFLLQDYGDPFGDAKIDPDEVEYQNPDFGFNNYLIFESEQQRLIGADGTSLSANWKFFMDYS